MADIILPILNFVGGTWFLWLPISLFYILRDTWLLYVRAFSIQNTKWILLEIRVPREVAKSPKAMESIFAGIHATAKGGNLIDRYWKGVFSPWFSLEIVGDAGGVHFYIWTPSFYKKMIEAQVYAQYPSSEVKEVEDYTKNFPKVLPNQEFDLWGTEFVHTKADAYPIRTYEEDFNIEKVSPKEEETKIDPLSSLVEFLGGLNEGENIWIQMIMRPSGDEWKKEGQELAAKLAGREPKVKESFITQVVFGIGGLLSSGAPAPEKKETAMPKIASLTPGEKDVLTAVEKNISKIGFDMGIRWLYMARRSSYNPLAIPAVMGVFKQYASPSLNSFRPNKMVTTSINYFLKKTLETKRKIRIYNAYKLRSFFHPPYAKRSQKIVLSSSELATIYHFPGMVAGAPGFARVEAKKGAPPTNLPM